MNLPEKKAEGITAAERGVFRNAVVLFGVLSAAALLYNLCIGKGTTSVLTALAALVFSAVCFFLDFFSGKFSSSYAVFAFGVSCILAPASFFLCGGFA